jgi:hypothetical protein
MNDNNPAKKPYLWKYKGKGAIWIQDDLETLVTLVAKNEALDPFDHTVRAHFKKEIVRQMCEEDPGLCSKSGLGDLVHLFAMPVAQLIDAVFNTRIKDCRGCKRRREWLNQRMPFRGQNP